MLQQCTKILLSIENDNNGDKKVDYRDYEITLRDRYSAYKERKQQTNKEVLAYHDFVALCAITAERKSSTPFLFDYTKLSYSIMCTNQSDESQDNMIVTYPQFKKWATKFYPLATKQNYKRYVSPYIECQDNDIT